MSLQKIGVFSLPPWAIVILSNNDATGVSDEDEIALNQWLEQHIYNEWEGVAVGDMTAPDFHHFPAFGLPCECVSVELWGHRHDQN